MLLSESVSKDVTTEQISAISATPNLLHELQRLRAAFAWLFSIQGSLWGDGQSWMAYDKELEEGADGTTPLEAIEALRAKGESVRLEICGIEKMLLEEIGCKTMKRKSVAKTYALGMRSLEMIDWDHVNSAIMVRWGVSGLDWIKKQTKGRKPCPFCGCRFIQLYCSFAGGWSKQHLACVKCGIRTQEYSSPLMATRRWNRRVKRKAKT